MSTSKHSELILDQFTRQAVSFATAAVIKDEAALRLLVEFAGAGPADTVLDVLAAPLNVQVPGVVGVTGSALAVGMIIAADATPPSRPPANMPYRPRRTVISDTFIRKHTPIGLRLLVAHRGLSE